MDEEDVIATIELLNLAQDLIEDLEIKNLYIDVEHSELLILDNLNHSEIKELIKIAERYHSELRYDPEYGLIIELFEVVE